MVNGSNIKNKRFDLHWYFVVETRLDTAVASAVQSSKYTRLGVTQTATSGKFAVFFTVGVAKIVVFRVATADVAT